MKVFIITQGEYSDYSIRAVSLDKDDAERKCATLNRNVRCGEYCEIEEYDTDDMVVETTEEVKRRFELTARQNTGEIRWYEESYLTFDDEYKIYSSKTDCFKCGSDKHISIVATLPANTTEEQAKKIMLERVAKFKAERAGL